jgi:hypothetical protein
MKKIGTYTVVFRATDSSGNRTDYSVLVNVVDDIGPVVYVDASVVRVYNSTVLSLSDFTSLLVKSGELGSADGFTITVRYDSYSDHAGVPGIYHLALDIESPDGNVLQKSFQILVSEAGTVYVPGPDDVNDDSGAKTAQIIAWASAGASFLALLASNVMWLFKMKRR